MPPTTPQTFARWELGRLARAWADRGQPLPVAVVVSIFDDLCESLALAPPGDDSVTSLDHVIIDQWGVARLTVRPRHPVRTVSNLLHDVLASAGGEDAIPAAAWPLLGQGLADDPWIRPPSTDVMQMLLRDALGPPAARDEVIGSCALMPPPARTIAELDRPITRDLPAEMEIVVESAVPMESATEVLSSMPIAPTPMPLEAWGPMHVAAEPLPVEARAAVLAAMARAMTPEPVTASEPMAAAVEPIAAAVEPPRRFEPARAMEAPRAMEPVRAVEPAPAIEPLRSMEPPPPLPRARPIEVAEPARKSLPLPPRAVSSPKLEIPSIVESAPPVRVAPLPEDLEDTPSLLPRPVLRHEPPKRRPVSLPAAPAARLGSTSSPPMDESGIRIPTDEGSGKWVLGGLVAATIFLLAWLLGLI